MRLEWENLSFSEREREYSPSSCLADGDYRPFIDAYRAQSEAAHAAAPPVTHRYGEKPSQSLDLFLPERRDAQVPLMVFFHGGYWQDLSKAESAFAAAQCLKRNIGFAAVDYTLAPNASIDTIVDECCSALDWLRHFSGTATIDPDRMYVSGSSAGAHLAAMAALRRPFVRGAILVSGIYDLAPLAGTYIDEALRLTPETIRSNSPLLADVSGFPPALVAWGEIETDQAKRQSRAFAAHLAAHSSPVETLEVSGRNHFDVILDLANPATGLGARAHALITNGKDHA